MENGCCYYFAYGSMCNPVSLSKRGIQPVSPSLPATISGYDLQFSYGGMANLVVADASSKVHGILHKVTPEHFKTLCEIESGYDTMAVPATPYQPHTCNSNHHCDCNHTSPGKPFESVKAQAYIIHPHRMAELRRLHSDPDVEFLPSERYITIITQGLQHFGADPAWIHRISSQPFQPHKTPDQYFTAEPASDPAQLPIWTEEQLAAYKGKIHHRRVIMACGPKVLEVGFSSKQGGPFAATLKDRMSGRDIAFGICEMLYNPKLPPLKSPKDVTAAHVAYAEDTTVGWVQLQGMVIRQVGWMKPQDGKQGDVQDAQEQN